MKGAKVFEVRMATLKDVEKIQALTKEAFEKYIQLAEIEDVEALHESHEEIINDIENKLVFVAFIGSELVGSVRIELLGDGNAYLSRFGVSIKYQNLGIGKAIMNLVDITMMANKVSKIQLHTASKVAGLIRFYYGRGFYVDSTTKDKGYIRAYMCKDYLC